jgi:hypothetical protein
VLTFLVLQDGEKIELSKLMMLMLTMVTIQPVYGKALLAVIVYKRAADSFGFKSTWMNSRTEGRKEFQ